MNPLKTEKENFIAKFRAENPASSRLTAKTAWAKHARKQGITIAPALLAKQLPNSTSFPRYVRVGQSIADCDRDSKDKAVRLTTRCWISTARWNEIAANSASIADAMKVALMEAHAARAAGKAAYAQICVLLDALDNPGFQTRRTALAIHAAEIAQ